MSVSAETFCERKADIRLDAIISIHGYGSLRLATARKVSTLREHDLSSGRRLRHGGEETWTRVLVRQRRSSLELAKKARAKWRGEFPMPRGGMTGRVVYQK